MSSSQRQAYLARRLAQARGKRPMVETNHDYQQEAGSSNRNEQGSCTYLFKMIQVYCSISVAKIYGRNTSILPNFCS